MAIPYTFTNGTVADGTEVNANFAYANPAVNEVYIGTGFDVSGIANTNEYELTAITSGTLGDANYVKITITLTSYATSDTGGESSTQLAIQAKEIAGAYGDIMAFQTTLHSETTNAGNWNEETTGTISFLHTLTAGEKTNGVQFKIKAQTTGTKTGSLKNIQTIVEIIGGSD